MGPTSANHLIINNVTFPILIEMTCLPIFIYNNNLPYFLLVVFKIPYNEKKKKKKIEKTRSEMLRFYTHFSEQKFFMDYCFGPM